MFRLTVEDVFVIRNRGVVATGRVESGLLRVGDTVHIEIFRKSIYAAKAGDNIGVLFQERRKGPTRSRLRTQATLAVPGGIRTLWAITPHPL
jgi:elongation factor Tu